jgi:tetratricopeptide (TPR) repeat protein
MRSCIFGLAAALLLVPAAGRSAPLPPKTEAAAPSAADLLAQGKIAPAVAAARKAPGGARAALQAVLARVDTQVSARKLAEARATLETAQKFADAYARRDAAGAPPREPIAARTLRLDGIELSDRKEYAQAESVLRRALDLSRQLKDATLEAGVRNNLGHALRLQQKDREAVREFVAARDGAEAQHDDLRAGSYNFNLGLALFQSKSFEQAFDAFKRSASQNDSAGNASIRARALLWQGRSLSAVSAVGAEPIKLFQEAQKLFQKLGDDDNAGWSYYYMADHIAYSFNFKQAAQFGEAAIPPFERAGDKKGLAAACELLADMYARLKDEQKSASYKKRALEARAPESPK